MYACGKREMFAAKLRLLYHNRPCKITRVFDSRFYMKCSSRIQILQQASLDRPVLDVFHFHRICVSEIMPMRLRDWNPHTLRNWRLPNGVWSARWLNKLRQPASNTANGRSAPKQSSRKNFVKRHVISSSSQVRVSDESQQHRWKMAYILCHV